MKISIACDHGGLQLKQLVKAYLEMQNHEVVDFGTNTLDSCDYPDFAKPCAQAVANGTVDKGIVICTSGVGVSIVANKVKGVRCALCFNKEMATLARQHNNANMLAMGAKYVGLDKFTGIVDAFLTTDFEGGRHIRRVEKIED